MSDQTKTPQEKITPDFYAGHGYKGNGKRGCEANIGNSKHPQRCGAGMFQHMWVAEYYGDDDE